MDLHHMKDKTSKAVEAKAKSLVWQKSLPLKENLLGKNHQDLKINNLESTMAAISMPSLIKKLNSFPWQAYKKEKNLRKILITSFQ